MSGSLALNRLLQALLTLLCVSFLVYMLIGLMPGDPVDLMAAGNPRFSPEDAARLRALYGLDQPLPLRYGRWLGNALQGDLGYSRLYNLPVLSVLWPRFWNTGLLLGVSLLLTIMFALPLGVQSARGAGGWADRAINLFCLAGISLPHFWLGILLMSLFAVTLGWLPAGASLEGDFSEDMRALVLPVATMTVGGLAVYVRHLRAAMVDALRADHIRTARAKGCSPRRTVWNHAFKNALPPVLTILMLDLGTLFSGALTVETVFGFPGMGKLMFDAVMGNDYNLALCGFMILTFFVLLANFLADFLYAALDPRVSYAGKR
ncbi:MAG TPA: ABC transporter permease [Patescibacteria group bacterium]|nr:ABC transporter permease [Patescibacteria group bacterium]